MPGWQSENHKKENRWKGDWTQSGVWHRTQNKVERLTQDTEQGWEADTESSPGLVRKNKESHSEMIPQMPPLIPLYKVGKSYHQVSDQQIKVSPGNVSAKDEKEIAAHLENQKQRTASLKRSYSAMNIKTCVSHPS